LSRERLRTDEDLAIERQQTDAEFEKISQSLEDEQMAHSETRKALLTRDEILAIVSHDLRNPIGTVLSCSSLLLEKPAVFHLIPDTERWVRIIKRNAESALGLIRNLLDVESLAHGKFILSKHDVDICELIRQLAENFDNEARVRFINLHIHLGDETLDVNCDRERILQVLSNLVGNAMKFTPKRGSVTIKAGRNDARDIEVSISDSGPGIPIEMRKLIFERFSQLGTLDQSGLGLGLYIAKEIVDAHHGRLSMDPAAGGGSRFTFTLPAL
jgi:signal transduction histidine kinase